MNQEKKAVSAYLQALELNEKHTKSYNCLGAIYEKNNQLDEATRFYRQAAFWGDVSAKQWGLEHGFHWL
jgi:Flp pilus assembly protein TadD